MSKFVLTAQLQLRAPTNTQQVVNQLRSQLQGQVNIPVSVTGSVQATKQIKQITQQTQQATTAAHNMGKAFGASIKKFAAFNIATRAVGLFASKISSAVDEAIKFERELIKISQVTGKSVQQLGKLTQTITNLATGLGVSSTALLETSRVLAQAGIKAGDLNVALTALAKTTLAPTFDNIAQTAEGAVAILAQFGEGVGALERQLGAINAVAGQFAVESGDLISVVRRTGGVFKQAGGDLQELIALFTSVRATTRENAESIATGLRTIFTRIQRPATISYLKQLGVELTDLNGRFVGPYEAVRRLSKAFGDLPQGDLRFVQIAEELGGFRQIGKVIPLLQQFATAEEARQAALAGGNSLNKDAEAAQKSLAVQFEKTREKFLALVRDISQTASFQIMIKSLLGIANAFIAMADAIKPILPLITAFAAVKFTRGIGSFVSGIGAGITKKNEGGKIHAFASGGTVPGTGNRDTVPAMLTPGEFVIRKSSVNKIGAGTLAAMNENKYAGGGTVQINPGAIGGFFLRPTQGEDRDYKIPKGKQITINNPDIKGVKSKSLSRDQFVSSMTAEEQANAGIIGRTASGKTKPKLSIPKSGGKGLGVQAQSQVGPEMDAAFAKGKKAGKDKIGTDKKFDIKGIIQGFFVGKNDVATGGIAQVVSDETKSGLTDTIKNTVAKIRSKELIDADPINANENRVFESSMKNLFEEGGAQSTVEGYILEGIISAISNAKLQGGTAAFDYKSFTGESKKRLSQMFGGKGEIDALVKADAKRTAGSKSWNSIIDKIEQDLNKRGVGAKDGAVTFAASGGSISGSTDTVPAMLTPGEFVINKKASQSIGYGNLNKMNKQGVVGFAKGGGVGIQKFKDGGTAQAGMVSPGLMGGFGKLEMVMMALTATLGGVNAAIENFGDKSLEASSKVAFNTIAAERGAKIATSLVAIWGGLWIAGKQLNSMKAQEEVASKLVADANKKEAASIAEVSDSPSEAAAPVKHKVEAAVESVEKASEGTKKKRVSLAEADDEQLEKGLAHAAKKTKAAEKELEGLSQRPEEKERDEAKADRSKVHGEAKEREKDRTARVKTLNSEEAQNIGELEEINADSRANMKRQRAAQAAKDAGEGMDDAGYYPEEILEETEKNQNRIKERRKTVQDKQKKNTEEREKIEGARGADIDAKEEADERFKAADEASKGPGKDLDAASRKVHDRKKKESAIDAEIQRRAAATGEPTEAAEPSKPAEPDKEPARPKKKPRSREAVELDMLSAHSQEFKKKKKVGEQESAVFAAKSRSEEVALREGNVQAELEETNRQRNEALSSRQAEGSSLKQRVGVREKDIDAEIEQERQRLGDASGKAGEDSAEQRRVSKENIKDLKRKKAANRQTLSEFDQGTGEMKASLQEDQGKDNEEFKASKQRQDAARKAVEAAEIDLQAAKQSAEAATDKKKAVSEELAAQKAAASERRKARKKASDPAPERSEGMKTLRNIERSRDEVKKGEEHAKESKKAAKEKGRGAETSNKSLKAEHKSIVAETKKSGEATKAQIKRLAEIRAEYQKNLQVIQRQKSIIANVTNLQKQAAAAGGDWNAVIAGYDPLITQAKKSTTAYERAIDEVRHPTKWYTKALKGVGKWTASAGRSTAKTVRQTKIGIKAEKLLAQARKKSAAAAKSAKSAGKEGRGMGAGAVRGAVGKVGGMAASIGMVGQQVFGGMAEFQQRDADLASRRMDVGGAADSTRRAAASESSAKAFTVGGFVEMMADPEGFVEREKATGNRKAADAAVSTNKALQADVTKGLTDSSRDEFRDGQGNLNIQKAMRASQRGFSESKAAISRVDDPEVKKQMMREFKTDAVAQTTAMVQSGASEKEIEDFIKNVGGGSAEVQKAMQKAAQSSLALKAAQEELTKANYESLQITSTFNAASVALDNFIGSVDGSSSVLSQNIAMMEAAQSNIGIDGSDAINAIEKELVSTLPDGSPGAELIKSQANQARAVADFNTNLEESLQSVELSANNPGQARQQLSDSIRGAAGGNEQLEKIAQAELAKLSDEQLKNVDITTFIQSIQSGAATLSKGFTESAKTLDKMNKQIVGLTARRKESELQYLAAQKQAIDVQLEAAKIIQEFGGAKVTPQDKKAANIAKFNTSAQAAGVTGLTTGSVEDFARVGNEIQQALSNQIAKGATPGGFGSQKDRVDNDKRKELAAAQKDLITAAKARVGQIREELNIIKKKNALEKSSLEKLVSGDIQGFIEGQAAVGAASAIRMGDTQTAQMFGADAIGAAFKDAQSQGLPPQEMAKFAKASMAAAGVTNPSAVETLSGTSAEEERLREEGRGLGGVIGSTAEQMVEAAQMNVVAQTVILEGAMLKKSDVLDKMSSKMPGSRPDPDKEVEGLYKGGPVYANRGIFVPRGTDTVPAMLTPGEFVVNRASVKRGNNLAILQAMNNGQQAAPGPAMNRGGSVRYYHDGDHVAPGGGGAGVGISAETVTSLNSAFAVFDTAVNKLVGIKLGVKLDPTVVTVNFENTSFLATLRDSVRDEVLAQVKNQMPNVGLNLSGDNTYDPDAVV